MEENLIKALSSLTGIRESKLRKLDKNTLYNIMDKPSMIEITKNELEQFNVLGELVLNLAMDKDFE